MEPLGRFHYHWWSLCISPSYMVYISAIYPKQYFARGYSFCHWSCGCCYDLQARTGKLPEKGVKFVRAISGWTATLLFMWMPVAQMMTNFLTPENIKGLSAFSMLLAMIGNGLMIPRALFIRDFMWFLGSSWASIFYGWGNLICLYYFNIISREFFLAATVGLYAWIGVAFWRDTKVYGYDSPLASMKELLSGS